MRGHRLRRRRRLLIRLLAASIRIVVVVAIVCSGCVTFALFRDRSIKPFSLTSLDRFYFNSTGDGNLTKSRNLSFEISQFCERFVATRRRNEGLVERMQNGFQEQVTRPASESASQPASQHRNQRNSHDVTFQQFWHFRHVIFSFSFIARKKRKRETRDEQYLAKKKTIYKMEICVFQCSRKGRQSTMTLVPSFSLLVPSLSLLAPSRSLLPPPSILSVHDLGGIFSPCRWGVIWELRGLRQLYPLMVTMTMAMMMNE